MNQEHLCPHVNVVLSPSSKWCAVPMLILVRASPNRNGTEGVCPHQAKQAGQLLHFTEWQGLFALVSLWALLYRESIDYVTLSAVVKQNAQANSLFANLVKLLVC